MRLPCPLASGISISGSLVGNLEALVDIEQVLALLFALGSRKCAVLIGEIEPKPVRPFNNSFPSHRCFET
jgi:hypothetical protein